MQLESFLIISTKILLKFKLFIAHIVIILYNIIEHNILCTLTEILKSLKYTFITQGGTINE